MVKDVPTIAMRVILKPNEDAQTVMRFTGLPGIKGEGTVSYTCGKCSTMLIENVSTGEVQDVVILCSACNSYNEMPAGG